MARSKITILESSKAKSKKGDAFHQYPAHSMAAAIQAVREEQISVREASRRFGVPKSTLQNRLKGNVSVPDDSQKMGPPSVLSPLEEGKLVKWITDVARCGFPRKKNDLLDSVQQIVKATRKITPFKDDRPGQTWYSSFMKRHPEITFREPESLTKGRAVISKEYIRLWFKDLQSHLKEVGAEDILKEPSRIYNGDETSFSLHPKTGKVLAPKGWKNIYDTHFSNEKDTLTVLMFFSASGKTLVPMVVFPFVRAPREIVEKMPQGWILGRSESGWMKSDIFYEYIANALNTYLEENKVKKPVLVFVDGHKSHLTLELSEFCSANGIILYALPPNTTHMMQPADVSVFKPLKSDWQRTFREWQNNPDNINQSLNRATFSPLLHTIFKKPGMEEIIKNGFRKCGLFPFNPNAVDYSKCIQNQLEILNSERNDYQPTHAEIQTVKKVLTFFEHNLRDNGISVSQVMKAITMIEQPNDSMTVIDEVHNCLDENNISFSFPNELEAFEDITNEIRDILDEETDFVLESGIAKVDSNGNSATAGINIFEDSVSINSVGHNISDEVMTIAWTSSANETTPKVIIETQVAPTPRPSTSWTIPANETTPQKAVEVIETQASPTPGPSTSALDSPFKKHLFYPKVIVPYNKRNKKSEQRMPGAISSDAWRRYMLKKDEIKQKELEEKQRKKEERERVKQERQQLSGSKKRNTKNKMKCKESTHHYDSEEDFGTSDEVDEPEVSKPHEVSTKIWKFGRSFPHVKPVSPSSTLATGDWVVVAFDSGNNKKRFWIGLVKLKEDDGDYIGSFLRPQSTKNFSGYVYSYPNIPDEYPFNLKQVVGKLDSPEHYGRSWMKFKLHHDNLKN